MIRNNHLFFCLYQILVLGLDLNFKTYIMTKARIREFIKEFCDEVYDMPDHALELHMDNHKCFQWYGRQYFVSESLSYWGQDAKECEDIWEHLVYNYGL